MLRFKAFHPDYSPSAEVTRTYTITPSAPTFNPTAGNYVAGQEVTVTAATSGSAIHYTINGVEPTTSDPTIASGSALVVGNYTLKAKAFKTGTTASATTTAAYTISGSVTPPAIAAGKEHSLAIRSDGVAWGWGNNAFGELGIGTTTTDKVLPVVISGLTGGVAIDAGGSHSHVLKDDGTWSGLATTPTAVSAMAPPPRASLPSRPSSSLTAVVAVSSGEDHTLALKGDGRCTRGAITATAKLAMAARPRVQLADGDHQRERGECGLRWGEFLARARSRTARSRRGAATTWAASAMRHDGHG